jgi:phenylalanyl-tRNA synthetase beta chain
MGGKVYAMNIKDKVNGNMVSPDMSPQMMEFKIENINKTLGMEFTEKQVRSYLAKMGIGIEEKKKKLYALVPAYRTDILHPIDLSEEVAIACGYDNFEAVIPEISTIAEENPASRQKRIMSEILSGLGLLETSSFHLQTKKNIKKIYFDFNDFIELTDSKTERDVLRMDMLTNLMQILSENSDAAYPQKIFEIGRVFAKDVEGTTDTGIVESERLACVLTDESITFTESKQILDYLFKMIDVKYEIENTEDHPGFIKGRCGKIIVDGKAIGHIGEVAPRVLKNWKLKFPAVAFELDVGFLI